MARSLTTEIEIRGTAPRIWQVLIDFPRYSEWNPFILRLEGTPRTGERLKARVQTPNLPRITIRPLVLRVDPERELRWLGYWLVPRIFDGEHVFRIEPRGDSRSAFIQSETYTGLLVPWIWKGMAGNIRAGFEKMSRALKQRVEAPPIGKGAAYPES
jgi:hypothetical protein